MRKLAIGLTMLSLGLLMACATVRKSQAASAHVYTLCELAANPSKYAGKTVRISAIFMTDMREHSVLMDPSCNSVRINLYNGPKGPYQASIDKLDKAEFKAYRELKPVTFKINFSAIFRIKPMPRELPFSKRERGRLHLTRVWSYSWLPRVPKGG